MTLKVLVQPVQHLGRKRDIITSATLLYLANITTSMEMGQLLGLGSMVLVAQPESSEKIIMAGELGEHH